MPSIEQQVRDMNERRLRIWERGKQILDRAAGEGRSLSNEESYNYDRINDDLNRIDRERDQLIASDGTHHEIDGINSEFDRVSSPGYVSEARSREARVLSDFMSGRISRFNIDSARGVCVTGLSRWDAGRCVRPSDGWRRTAIHERRLGWRRRFVDDPVTRQPRSLPSDAKFQHHAGHPDDDHQHADWCAAVGPGDHARCHERKSRHKTRAIRAPIRRSRTSCSRHTTWATSSPIANDLIQDASIDLLSWVSDGDGDRGSRSSKRQASLLGRVVLHRSVCSPRRRPVRRGR